MSNSKDLPDWLIEALNSRFRVEIYKCRDVLLMKNDDTCVFGHVETLDDVLSLISQWHFDSWREERQKRAHATALVVELSSIIEERDDQIKAFKEQYAAKSGIGWSTVRSYLDDAACGTDTMLNVDYLEKVCNTKLYPPERVIAALLNHIDEQNAEGGLCDQGLL
jgi:hypothetical protein